VYCPQCRAEFREGFTECSDCHVPLSEGSPPPSRFDPSLDPIIVLVTNDQIQLAMAKGLRDCEAEARHILASVLQPAESPQTRS
jgi:hypothetical protein